MRDLDKLARMHHVHTKFHTQNPSAYCLKIANEVLEGTKRHRLFLSKIRFCLHMQAQRAQEQLFFDAQFNTAEMLEFRASHQSAHENMMKKVMPTIALQAFMMY